MDGWIERVGNRIEYYSFHPQSYSPVTAAKGTTANRMMLTGSEDEMRRRKTGTKRADK